VGELDASGRRTILDHYLSRLNTGEIDRGRIVELTGGYTPADIEYLFHQVAQFAFEREYETGQDYRVTIDTFQQILPKIRPSLTDEMIEELHKDSLTYSRA
jgi:SpoVK/Ycf46/Vps4 family AAA+-type ATPase